MKLFFYLKVLFSDIKILKHSQIMYYACLYYDSVVEFGSYHTPAFCFLSTMACTMQPDNAKCCKILK